MERCSVLVLTFKPNSSALHFDEAACDVESQSGAWYFACFGILGAEELLEYPLLIFRADAYARVPDPHMHNLAGAFQVPMICRGLGADDQRAAPGRVLVGIAYQIGEDLPKPCAIRPDLRQLRGQFP